MNIQHVNIVARYEAKLLRRNIVFLGFVILAMIGISLWQVVNQGGDNVFWYKVAFASSLPFFNVYYYNLVQVLIAVFVSMEVVYRERKREAMEVFLCRPFRNSEYCIGRFWGIFKMFLFVNVCVLSACMCLNVWVIGGPFNMWVYIFYLFTLSVPTLVFVLGCSLAVTEIVKNRSVSVLLLVILGGSVYFYLDEWQFGMFDFWGRNLPNMFSDLTGHPDIQVYLLHRLGYFGLGIAGILVWMASMNRLRDCLEYRRLQWGTGMIVIVGSVVCLLLFRNTIRQRELQAELYRQVYVEYQLKPKVRVVRHDITYEWKDGEMVLDSRMVLQNRNTESLSEIVLYLNPALKIYSMGEEGKKLSFHREQQLVVIERPLLPGDSVTLQLAYRGKIDETICYPDISWENKQSAGKYEPRSRLKGLFNFGVHYAFADERYTLLLPGCLWYPVTVPPVNVISPSAGPVNFSEYSLQVKVGEGQQVLSQGISLRKFGNVVFRNEQKLPGISLCIGNYQKKEVQVGDISVEFYYFSDHEEFFEGFTLLGKEMLVKELRSIQERMESGFGRNYPFHKLMLVESPLSFVSFLQFWKTGSDFVQPEMVFFNERGATLPGYVPLYRWKAMIEAREGPLDDSEKIYGVERMRLLACGMLLQQGMYSILPMYYDYTSFLSSATYPAINMLLSEAFALKGRLTVGRSLVRPSDIEVVECLKKKSLREILSDDSLSDKLRVEIFKLQGKNLASILSAFVNPDELYRFSERIASRFQFDEITFDRFAEDFQLELGLDLIPILDRVYQTVGLAILDVRDIRVEQVVTEGYPRYLLSFKVRNISDVDGVITCVADNQTIEELRDVYKNAIPPDLDASLKVQDYVIAAGACKEVKFIMYGDCGYISTNLSANLPREYYIEVVREGISKTCDQCEGIFDIDSNLFHEPGVIIVDNASSQFQLVDSGQPKRLPFFAKEQKKVYKMVFDNVEWTEIITSTSYGIPVQSAFCKLAGEGNGKAIWTVNVQKAGKYEVFFYHQFLSMTGPPVSSVFTGSLLHYRICIEVLDENVVVEADLVPEGCVSLGKFDFSVGEVQVILDDRGGNIRMDAEDQNLNVIVSSTEQSLPKRQLIIADAVKLVRVKE